MVVHLNPDYTAKPATHVAGSIMPLSGNICPMTIACAQKRNSNSGDVNLATKAQGQEVWSAP
jgi:hypothetical protein